MLVSFTLTPMLSSRFLSLADAQKDHKTKEGGFFHALDRWYTRSLNWSLDHPVAIVGIAVAVLLTTFPLNAMVGRTFVPTDDMGEWTVHLDTPEGTSLDGSAAIALSLVKELDGIEGVARLQPTINQRVTHIHLIAQALPLDQRTSSQEQMVAEMRRRLAAHPGLRPSITSRNPLGGGESGGFPISAALLGPDLDVLATYSLKAIEQAQKLPSLADPKISLNIANPEIRVALDRRRAADLGVRMKTVGDALRLMVAGDDEISTFREGAEQYPVKMRVLESQRNDLEAIGKLTVASSKGGQVRIDNIARLDRGLGPSTLQRYNRQFSVNLIADVAPGHALDEASNDVRRVLNGLQLPPGYSFRLSGQTKILDETTANLMMAIALASIFVYMVLAAQFESFIQPIVIMTVLPLSVPFALFTLWATGRQLSLWSALGVLLLLGIVKKNSILQVDYANVLRAQGKELREAIVEASRTRLRPILMTTCAILAGLVPTAFGLGVGGQQRAAIAVTIIGGQSLCLFLTLLLVPVAYVKLDVLEQPATMQRAKALMGRVITSTVGRLRPARRDA
jgi:HAE1 family hydrophobic/amphiphilic exporter-1